MSGDKKRFLKKFLKREAAQSKIIADNLSPPTASALTVNDMLTELFPRKSIRSFRELGDLLAKQTATASTKREARLVVRTLRSLNFRSINQCLVARQALAQGSIAAEINSRYRDEINELKTIVGLLDPKKTLKTKRRPNSSNITYLGSKTANSLINQSAVAAGMSMDYTHRNKADPCKQPNRFLRYALREAIQQVAGVGLGTRDCTVFCTTDKELERIKTSIIEAFTGVGVNPNQISFRPYALIIRKPEDKDQTVFFVPYQGLKDGQSLAGVEIEFNLQPVPPERRHEVVRIQQALLSIKPKHVPKPTVVAP